MDILNVSVERILIVSIILSLSFCLLASVVLIYYVRRRYLLHFDIKSISQDELMLQSFQNNRENLRIKALISNFIIVIVLVEIFYSLLFSVHGIFLLVHWHYILDFSPSSFIYNHLNVILCLCQPLPILSLLLNVLWLIYLNSPYKYTIIRWTWYIVIRCGILVVIIFCYLQNTNQVINGWYDITCSTIEAIYILVNTADFIIYLVYARRLYIQLKSGEKEARWFKDREIKIFKTFLFFVGIIQFNFEYKF